MSTSDNDFEIHLLHSDPQALIMRYQFIVHLTVKHYIKTNLILSDDYEDMVQMINEKLLFQIPAIQQQYNGTTRLVTYFSVVIKNFCLIIYREKNQTKQLLYGKREERGHNILPDNTLLINEEVERFSTIMQFFPKQKMKMIICLKIYFYLPLFEKELLNLLQRWSKKDRAVLLTHFGSSYEHMFAYETFKIISDIFNKYEKVDSTADATLRWTQRKITEILSLLNGKPPSRAHTKKTLKILLDNYTSPFLFLKNQRDHHENNNIF